MDRASRGGGPKQRWGTQNWANDAWCSTLIKLQSFAGCKQQKSTLEEQSLSNSVQSNQGPRLLGSLHILYTWNSGPHSLMGTPLM